MPTISVIIPCFNAQNTIIRALDSVLAQSYKEYDVICIDDGSEDSTKELIEQYIKQNPNSSIEYIYQTNQGPSKARNVGIQASKSEYIAFLDSDDEWHPQKLEIQMRVIKENSLDFLGSTYQYTPFSNIEEEPSVESYSFYQLLLKTRFSTPGVIMKKEFFEALGGFDLGFKYAEDHDLWLRGSLSHDLFHIKEPALLRLYKPAYGASGLSSSMYEMFQGELSVLKKLYISKDINFFFYHFVQLFTTLKFLKRLVFKRFKAKV